MSCDMSVDSYFPWLLQEVSWSWSCTIYSSQPFPLGSRQTASAVSYGEVNFRIVKRCEEIIKGTIASETFTMA